MDDEQFNTGVDIPETSVDVETPETDNAQPQEEENKSNGGNPGHKMVEVPEFVLHRHNRYREQSAKKSVRIEELEAELKDLRIPNREEYGDDVDKYVDDRVAAQTRRLSAENELQQHKTAMPQMEQQAIAEMWGHKVQEARKMLPDFDDKLKAVANVQIKSKGMMSLQTHPAGVNALYYLASNPQVAQQVSMMPEENQAMYINQLGTNLQLAMQGNLSTVQAQPQETQTQTMPEPTALVEPVQRPRPTPQVSSRSRTPAQSSNNLHDFARKFNQERRRR